MAGNCRQKRATMFVCTYTYYKRLNFAFSSFFLKNTNVYSLAKKFLGTYNYIQLLHTWLLGKSNVFCKKSANLKGYFAQLIMPYQTLCSISLL